MRGPRPPAGISPFPRSNPFIDPVAVEAWDAWFRCRDGDQLIDATVDATWQRVANALAGVQTRGRANWSARLLDALSAWHLLPDPRILALAGTASHDWDALEPVAVLNLSSFVRAQLSEQPRFDPVQFERVAELAVSALDNAALLAGGRAPRAMRIGLIGAADALSLLGLRYDSAEGRAFIADAARLLAQGSLTGAIALAADRGAASPATPELVERARRRGVAAEQIAAIETGGMRCGQLTAITSQPRLALFANNVADALLPLAGNDVAVAIDGPEGVRRLRSSGYALTMHRRCSPASRCICMENIRTAVSATAEQAMREAVQPWIDCPVEV